MSEQTPIGGTRAEVESEVFLIVSSGPAPPVVPNVIGLMQGEAEAAIEAERLVPVVEMQSTANKQAGEVFGQEPGGGTVAEPGDEVIITVSTGLAQLPVPNVVGLPEALAIDAIEAAGLVASVSLEASASVDPGEVGRQDPEAGALADVGSSVDLFVATATVPDVVGLQQADAVAAVEAASLDAIVVGEVNESVPSGEVLRQLPESGSERQAGSSVVLVVATGPLVPVPDVIGLMQAEAVAEVEAAGFVATTQEQMNTGVPVGEVFSQAPLGGVEAEFGSEVLLVVSTGRGLATVPNVLGLTAPQAVTTVEAAGFIARVTEEPSSGVPVGDVSEQTPIGGTRAEVESEVFLTVSSGPAPLVIDEFDVDILPTTNPVFPADLDILGDEADVIPDLGLSYSQADGYASFSSGLDAGRLDAFQIEVSELSRSDSASVEIRVYSGDQLGNYVWGFVPSIMETGALELPFSSFMIEGAGASLEDASQIDVLFDIDADETIEIESILIVIPEPSRGVLALAALLALRILAARARRRSARGGG